MRYHHTKAPENLLNVSVGILAGHELIRIWAQVSCVASSVKRFRHLTKLFGAEVVKPLL